MLVFDRLSQVLMLNGQRINNLKDLVAKVDSCKMPYLDFDLDYHQKLVLNTQAAKKATEVSMGLFLEGSLLSERTAKPSAAGTCITTATTGRLLEAATLSRKSTRAADLICVLLQEILAMHCISQDRSADLLPSGDGAAGPSSPAHSPENGKPLDRGDQDDSRKQSGRSVKPPGRLNL